MSKTLLAAFFTFSAYAAEFPLEYKVTCGASRHLSSGAIPPTPEVTVTARVKLTPFTGTGHLCNQAVTADADQKKYRVQADVVVGVELADKSSYLNLTTGRSKFGECELSPGVERPGVLVISSRKALCTPPTACGSYGVIDPTRTQHEIEGVSFFLNLEDDGHGGRKLGEDTSYVLLEKIPTGGHHFPVHSPFKLNECRFE